MIKKYIPDSAESSTKAVKPVAAGKKNAGSKSASAKPPKMTSPTQKSPKPEFKSGAKTTNVKAANAKTDGAKTSGAKASGSKVSGTSASGNNSGRSQKPSGAKTSAKPDAGATPAVVAPTDEKLQKVLASAGLGSRREMERVIEAGKVKVNDRIATLGDRVTSKDKIFVDGKRVLLRAEASRRRVILYNKPEGEICSRSDPEGRPTVYDNLPPLKGERWISVGRLDFNTSGLLLFTNDGELANKLMHPSSVIDREYLVRIQGDVDDEMKQHLLEGVLLDDGVARFTDIVDGAGEGKNRWFYCVVMEGRNREVRRLWESQGVKVSRLKRVRYANIFIPSHVRVGQWIDLTDREIQDLCMTAGFDSSNYTRIMQASRDEQAQMQRHDKKLRSASSPPKRVKTTLRKKPKQ
jgi:23S rRNA pseudouridine2605 synthase